MKRSGYATGMSAPPCELPLKEYEKLLKARISQLPANCWQQLSR